MQANTSQTSSRSRRTRSDIKRALQTVMDHKPLVDVTVAEVARAADISRGTFYLHYSNISEVYDEMVRDFVFQTLDDAKNTKGIRSARNVHSESIQDIKDPRSSTAKNAALSGAPSEINKINDATKNSLSENTLSKNFDTNSTGIDSTRKFCNAIKEAHSNNSVLKQGQFLKSFIDAGLDSDSQIRKKLIDNGLSPALAKSIEIFRLSGCFYVATNFDGNSREWEETIDALDEFIESGMKVFKQL